MKKIYVVIFVFSLFSCWSNRGNDIRPAQQRLENYNGSVAFTVAERILTTPATILNLLNQLDNVDYSSYELNNDEKQLFMDYFDLLPLVHKYIIIEKVIGIYFINDFARSGMTEPVYDDYGNLYTVIFLNPEILYQNLSEWINYKDNSIFEDNDSRISVIIECDNTYQAIFCVLLHEASHVYDFINHVTPPLSGETTSHTDFTNDIWKNYYEPIERFDFANRQNMVFYSSEEKIRKEYALDMYTALSHTPFSSLYGSTTWIEDFAESFTWYYLNKYHDIKYVTYIMENEITLLSYDPNENELVKRRYGIFEKILE